MGDVTEFKRRFLSGLDADKPATGLNGDRYYATDAERLYFWTASGWVTGKGAEFVSRAVTAVDFTQTVLTLTGAWQVNGLDLSAIVPAGAVAVKVMAAIKDNAADKLFMIRQNATNNFNRAEWYTQVANIYIPSIPVVIAIDSDRLWDYNGDANMDIINLYIQGWYI